MAFLTWFRYFLLGSFSSAILFSNFFLHPFIYVSIHSWTLPESLLCISCSITDTMSTKIQGHALCSRSSVLLERWMCKKIIIIQCDKVPWGRNMLGAMQLQGGHEQESWKGNVLVRLLREGAWIGHWWGEGLGYSLSSSLWFVKCW